jgi:Spy/CpxP family protein refolding chaperone
MHRPRRAAALPRSRLPRTPLALLVLLALVGTLALGGCGDGGDAPRRRTPGEETFEGIDLSALQRTRIRLVQERYADRVRSVQARVMPLVRESRVAWVRGDSAAAVAAWVRSAADRAALRVLGDSMRVEIREILSAEQRPRFDRNVAAELARSDDLDRRQGRPEPPGRPDSAPR